MIWAIEKDDDWMSVPIKKQLKFIDNNDSKFKPWLDKYKYHDRFPEKNREFYQEKCALFLNLYNDMLSTHSFLLGNSLVFSDAAIFPFIRQCAHIDTEWFSNNFPALNKWLNNWKESNLFLSVMNKYQEWKPNTNPEIVNFNK
jgi:glutathione S-transferase